jgi:glycosyltransferase involved in cell wall biosynthesis
MALGKPRLLIILNRFVIGGQAVDTIPLAWHLSNQFDILVLYGEKEKDEIEPDFLLQQYPDLQLKKIKQLRRSINPFVDFVAFFHVLFSIVKFKADIVHTHGAKSGFIGRVAAWAAGVPVIIHTFHGHFFHSYFSTIVSGLIASVEKAIGRITTCAIALSCDQKKELVETYGVLPDSKVKIIQLGLDITSVEDGASLRASFRARYGLSTGDVAIGIVGRIVPVKNHSLFVSVLQELKAIPTTNPAAFFIIGDGDLKSQVQRELQQKGISFNTGSITPHNRVVFTSWLTEMYEVMNGLDIIVLTSLNEGTPLSLIEAQFFKKPVVATKVGGVTDTVIAGKTGFLSESNDVTTFAHNLRLLIDDKGLRFQMGEEGYHFVSDRFSKQKEVEITQLLYIDLLRKKGYSL